MTKGSIILSLFCVAAFYGIALGSISYADRTDPYRIDNVYSSVAVIQPYRGD